MQYRTYSWIARQNPDIRMTRNKLKDNKKFSFPALSKKKIQAPLPERNAWFKKGELWPTIVLVEKGWDETGTKKTEDAYIRIFRHEDGAILDILVGESLDDATLLAVDFNIPLFSVTCSRKGTRGTVQRIHMDII
ncbi:MAG: hypothetical protein ACFFB2_12755 [Promethearchaeota archaeon]